jgi:hypothetical protein
MNTEKYAVAAELGQSTGPSDGSDNLRMRWSVITSLIVFAVLMEALFAGAMLSGVSWARAAHAVTAAIVIVGSLAAGLVCVITLRRISHGLKLGRTLLALTAALILQAAVGALSAKGANLLWIHIPLGVALFGFAMRAAAAVRPARIRSESRQF